MAQAVTGFDQGYPPILCVYEFDPSSAHIGEVHPGQYDQFRDLRALTAEALGALPANHFVWSDELVQAYSDYIDLTSDRPTAMEGGLKIRWNPALGDCRDVIAQSIDLSRLSAGPLHRTKVRDGIRTFVFAGNEISLGEQNGLALISTLLLNAHKAFAAADLEVRALPAVPVDDDAVNAVTGKWEGQEESASSLTQRMHADSFGDAVYDDAAIKDIRTRLTELTEQRDDQRERGNHEKAAELDDKIEELQQWFEAGMNVKGRPRRLGSDRDKVRKRVGNAIRRGIDAIQPVDPALAAHLENFITTGNDCSYRPVPAVRWSP